jgi:phosphoglycerate dehydrogenase-like enzyme
MTAAYNVLVYLHEDFPMETSYADRMREALPGGVFSVSDKNSVTDAEISSAEILIGNPSMRQLQTAKKLRWLQLMSAGADYYCAEPDILPKNLLITNVSGAFGLSISEHLIGALLMLMRHLHLYRDDQRDRLWQPRQKIDSIDGSTILVAGLGDLGSEFARKAKALGAYVVGVRRSSSKKPDFLDELHTFGKLDDLLPLADVVALCLPSTKETRGLFDGPRLSRMKKGAYLLNAGRGDAVDCSALALSLGEDRLAGAALDVTDPEPLPPEHPLWKQPNAVITPHCAGGYSLPRTVYKIMDIICGNLTRFSQGEPLRNIVDIELGYRSQL